MLLKIIRLLINPALMNPTLTINLILTINPMLTNVAFRINYAFNVYFILSKLIYFSIIKRKVYDIVWYVLIKIPVNIKFISDTEKLMKGMY